MQLELKIIGKMLSDPDKTERHTIKANWFGDKTNRELAYVLLNAEKRFEDYSEIEMAVKEYYPKSVITEDWLEQTSFEAISIADLKTSIKMLEVEYIKRQLNEAMIANIEYPSKRNREKLEDWLRELNEIEVEEDTGELDTPIQQLLYELENETESGIQTYKQLDTVLGNAIEKEMLYVLAARPGLGKTTYAMNIALEAIQKNPDVQIDFFSLEMGKMEVLKKMISRLTRINSYKFNNAKVALNDDEKVAVVNSASYIHDSGLRIHDDKYKLSEIERTIRQRHHEAQGKPYLAIVDYVGLVNGESAHNQRYREVGMISRTFKMLTGTLKIPIILISQLNRDVENRQDKKPYLADLRESGDLEQDANVVILLSIDLEDSEADDLNLVMDVDIAKNRKGVTGIIKYVYDKPTQNFMEYKK